MTFEEKNKRIEEIVSRLKNDEIGLEESIKLYEEASKLTKECFDTLSKGSGKVKIISSELEEIEFKDI